jgi:vacuolar-type H+-ATPase subunit I/STV1
MKEPKLTESQINELLGEVKKMKNTQIIDVQKQIRDLEAELEWAESQATEDYKYISNLENRLDDLYEKFSQLDEK